MVVVSKYGIFGSDILKETLNEIENEALRQPIKPLL